MSGGTGRGRGNKMFRHLAHEGNSPSVAFIRCTIDSIGKIKVIKFANDEALGLMGLNLSSVTNKPVEKVISSCKRHLPWKKLFHAASLRSVPFVEDGLRSTTGRQLSVTYLSTEIPDELLIIIKDTSIEHYSYNLREQITKYQYDILLLLDEYLIIRNIEFSTDEDILSKSRKELMGHTLKEVFGPNFARPVNNLLLGIKDDGESSSMIYYSPDIQNPRRLKINGQKISSGQLFHYILNIKDITSEIDFSSRPLKDFYQGILVYDEKGIIISANSLFERMTGFKMDEIVGKQVHEFLKTATASQTYETTIVTKQKKHFRVNVTNSVLEHIRSEKLYIAAITEISGIISTQRLLERKKIFEDILFDMTTKMLISDEITFNSTINNALITLGTFSGADRAYVFMFRQEKTMDNTHEWVASGITSQIENLQQLPQRMFPNWVSTINKGKELYIHDIDSLESNWKAEQKLLQAQQIKSVLVTPIIGHKKVFGFIGFDAVTSNMSWTNDERRLLRFYANTIGETLARKENTLLLNEMRDKAESLASEREQINRELNSFFAKMSHEIRNSINSIIGINQMLMDTDLDATQKRYSKIIRSNSEFLLNLIRDVLDFSRMNDHVVDLHLSKFSLSEIILQVIDSLRVFADDKELTMEFVEDENLNKSLYGDAVRISQIVSNLVSNAIKYTETGSIRISTKLVNSDSNQITASIMVEDTGIGIKEADLEKIFEPYFQIDDSSRQTLESSGLGLPIVQWLVGAMGGTINVESEYMKGSTFTCTLPLQVIAQEESYLSGDPSWKDKKVLIAQADLEKMKELTSLLNAWGFQIDTVQTRNKLKEKVSQLIDAENPYSVCFIDSSFIDDQINTYLLSCKTSGRFFHHLLFLTSHVSPDLTAESANCPFDGYLLYPVDENFLYEQLKTKMDRMSIEKALVYDDFKVLSGLDILIVDDIAINREIIMYHFDKVGIHGDHTDNGLTAVEMVKQNNYDIVLLDIQMPKIDGYETCARIRALGDKKKSKVPIIAMTGNVAPGEREKCLIAKMDDYLEKPVKAEQLYGSLLQFLPSEMYLSPRQNRIEINDESSIMNPLTGIDTNRALKNLQNDKELYIKLLNQFYDEYHDYARIYNDTAEKETERIRFVHSIKSVAANLGAMKLSRLASDLEKMIPDMEYEYYAEIQHSFMKEFAIVIQSIEHSPYCIKEEEPAILEKEDIGLNRLLEILSKLQQDLRTGNRNSINSTVEELNQLRFEEGYKEKMTVIRNTIRLYDYQKAEIYVGEMIGDLEP